MFHVERFVNIGLYLSIRTMVLQLNNLGYLSRYEKGGAVKTDNSGDNVIANMSEG
jgi:hypothetical protein